MMLREVSTAIEVDLSPISKFEKNERKPILEKVTRFAKVYYLSENKLVASWYS